MSVSSRACLSGRVGGSDSAFLSEIRQQSNLPVAPRKTLAAAHDKGCPKIFTSHQRCKTAGTVVAGHSCSSQPSRCPVVNSAEVGNEIVRRRFFRDDGGGEVTPPSSKDGVRRPRRVPGFLQRTLICRGGRTNPPPTTPSRRVGPGRLLWAAARLAHPLATPASAGPFRGNKIVVPVFSGRKWDG
jgi:hypothetical protein